MCEVVLKTEKLTKRYKNFTALDSVDMTVYRGDIYGMVGRNGAGKTTAMKIITGLTGKTGGDYEIFSKRGAAANGEKRRIGCLIENPAFFGGLTAYENLKYYAIQKGITDSAQIDAALEMVKLTEAKNKKFRRFSLGMKQRLGIAFAMLDNPDLVILDEPINGLDPIGISELRETFHMLNTEYGITFIISSHILSELYITADRFLFIDHGRALKEITKQELDYECRRCIAVNVNDTKKASAVLEKNLAVTDYKVTDAGEIRIYQENVNPAQIVKMFVADGIDVFFIQETGISLEDYFKALVGEGK